MDRSAAQWFKLQVASSSLTYTNHRRIYDSGASNPYWYFFPSLNVNSAGDILVGFSGSRTAEHVAGFFCGYKADGTSMSRPALVQAGRAASTADRWGDYSATTIDPADGSFWTVQESAIDDGFGTGMWGTWIMQIRSPLEAI